MILLICFTLKKKNQYPKKGPSQFYGTKKHAPFLFKENNLYGTGSPLRGVSCHTSYSCSNTLSTPLPTLGPTLLSLFGKIFQCTRNMGRYNICNYTIEGTLENFFSMTCIYCPVFSTH